MKEDKHMKLAVQIFHWNSFKCMWSISILKILAELFDAIKTVSLIFILMGNYNIGFKLISFTKRIGQDNSVIQSLPYLKYLS